jgi:hypothetical protein
MGTYEINHHASVDFDLSWIDPRIQQSDAPVVELSKTLRQRLQHMLQSLRVELHLGHRIWPANTAAGAVERVTGLANQFW